MSQEKNKYSCRYWVDDLNFFSFLQLILLRLFNKGKEVRYLKISKIFRLFIQKLKINNLFILEQIPQSSRDMSSHEELKFYQNSLRDEKSSLAIDIARRVAIQEHLLSKLDDKYDKTKVALYFKQEIACDIKDFSLIINFIRWYKAKEDADVESPNILIIKTNIWHKYIQSYAKDLVTNIYIYPNLNKIRDFLFTYWKIIFEMVVNSLVVIFNNRDVPEPGKPKIAVLHAQGADLNKKSDYLWFKNSSIDPERILVYFKYHCWPPKKESLECIKSYNMGWINLLPWKLSISNLTSRAPEIYRLPHSRYIKKLLRILLKLIRLFFHCFSGTSKIMFWQLRCLANLLDRVTFYEAFFEIYNIKIHYGLYGGGVDMIASNLAAKLVGGVDICHHWSNFNAVEIMIGQLHDIFFSWSPYYKQNFLDNDFFKLGHVVYTGYPYDYLFDYSQQQSRLHRQKLMKNGAKFIVCFFDQAYTDSWPKANKDIEDVYRALLNKVITDSDFGLINKPKRNISFSKSMPGLSKLAKDAVNTGRCLFLDRDTFTNQAAQAADLVVGFTIHTTPSFEAALSGIPIIICDPQKFTSHPLYKEDLSTIVFNQLGKMMAVIENIKNGNVNYSELIDISSILNKIDSFRDRRAYQRIGSFIRWVLEEFDQGASRTEAMDTAVGRYRRQWGNDKVASFGEGEEAYSGERVGVH